MSELLDAALQAVRRLRADGHETYFAGGYVRDRLMGRPIHEIDIATSARPDQVERLFARTVAVGRAFGVIRVEREGHWFEVATFRSEGRYLDGRHPESVTFSGPREDAQRRDFTINGMFFDPLENRTLDFVDGQADLRRRIIRAIGRPEERFAEDNLRLMRAVRFATQLDFSIDPATEEAIRALAPSIAHVSAERVRDELAKLLVAPRRSEGLERLRATHLLKHLLPEVEAMVGVPQPPEYHPEGDVWTHTRLCLETLRDPSFELALAVLLHDIGKPKTLLIADRIRFNGHDKVGAHMADAIATRLKLSNDQRDRIVWLVDRHLAFLQWEHMKQSTLKRLLAHEHIGDLLKLVRADTLGSRADDAYVDRLEAIRATMTIEKLKPPPLLTGNDLIDMGYAPGPRFKSVLREVFDAQLEGTIRTGEEARALAQRLMKERPASD
ncbi:MAG: CCA tRNA nucleotidyltransferase [Planctomycetes bacterium]|nr:CCA tRNA nucleotidyltransferase [Planctomycetota bacterium]